jgi:hydroxyacylglutathione hydrolase
MRRGFIRALGRTGHRRGWAGAVLILGFLLVFTPAAKARDSTASSKQLAEALSKFQTVNKRFAQGRALFARGNLAAAAREFEACVNALPGHAYARFYLANIRYLQGNYAGALEFIEEAERQAGFLEALDAYAREQNIRTMEDARRVLEAENETNGSCRESRKLEQLVRIVDEDKKKLDDRAAEEGLSRKRRASLYAYFHGNVLFQLRRFDEAFEQYKRAIEAEPRNGDACNNAAAILFMAGRPQEAEGYLEKAVAAGVEDKINLKLKKLVAEKLGKPTAGILEEEFGSPDAGGVRVMRFAVNANAGRPNSVPLFVNTYIVYDGGSRDALIVDPGAADARIEDYIAGNGLKPRLILNTHGHEDHRGGDAHYAGLYGIDVAAPREDRSFYENDGTGAAGKISPVFITAQSSGLRTGTLTVRIFETPGHTPGGLCFLVGGFLLTGDSLFEDTIGRIGAGDEAERLKIRKAMIARLLNVLAPLPGETALLPGHGKATTAARVRQANTWLKETVRESSLN